MTGTLRDRRIAVGIGGGIAAYRVGDVVRELRRHGAQVRVAMTKTAQEFVTPVTLQGLSGHPVLTDLFDPSQEANFGHLQLARWAQAFVVAPATADLIARLRAGMANDEVTTSLVAYRGPVLLAPAMNTAMWDNEITQDNVRALLRLRRFHVVGPGTGPLADGDVGVGRLAEVAEIVAATEALFNEGPLTGKKVLVTAGPTREPIDPVRYVSNPSTGKMGLAIAHAARALGAQVTVVLGPVAADVELEGLDVLHVHTADEMLSAVMKHIDQADVFVAAAAVSDYKPKSFSERKLKKGEGSELLAFVRTPDVLATASTHVHHQVRRPLLVGFAAETHDVLANAKDKLIRKKLDLIVANDITAPGAGFGTDTNSVTFLEPSGHAVSCHGSKRQVADKLWELVVPLAQHR